MVTRPSSTEEISGIGANSCLASAPSSTSEKKFRSGSVTFSRPRARTIPPARVPPTSVSSSCPSRSTSVPMSSRLAIALPHCRSRMITRPAPAERSFSNEKVASTRPRSGASERRPTSGATCARSRPVRRKDPLSSAGRHRVRLLVAGIPSLDLE